MHPLTIPAVAVTACLIAGAAWAQGTSSSGGTGGGGGSSTGSTSTGSTSTGSVPAPNSLTQPNSGGNPTVLPIPRQGAQGNADNPATNRDATGNTTTTGPIPPAGTEGSTGSAANRNQPSTGPATTGSVSGVNRRPGERSAIGPTQREEELFQEGEQIEQRARRLCEGCEE